MKAKQLREKSIDALQDEITQLLKDQFRLRMQRASEQPPRPHQFKVARREIARIKTLINEKKRTG